MKFVKLSSYLKKYVNFKIHAKEIEDNYLKAEGYLPQQNRCRLIL